MRIASVEVVPLRFAIEPAFRAAVRTIDSIDPVLVRLRDADGVEGVGTAFAFGAGDALPIVAAARALGAARVGGDARAPESHARAMQQSLAIAGATGAALAALSAIEVALWDLAARRASVPLWRLLGGARDAVPAYGSGGSLALSTAGLVDEVGRFVAAGHRAVKVKAGHGIAGDRERLQALRDAFGPSLAIAVDGNQQWTPKAAIRWAHEMARFEPWWLEEPVRADDVAGHVEVRAAVSMDVATGESLHGTADPMRLVAARGADVLMPNLQRIGGIAAWRRVAAAAELAGLSVAAHVHPEVQVHLCCATPNAVALECWPGWPWLWQEPLAVRDGVARPPEAPGLGFTPDEARIATHRVDR